MVTAPALSLADLEQFDPHSPRREPERDFLCPLCGDGKKKDAAHRSLSANVRTGLWECHRCKEKGKLRDFWEERDFPTYQRGCPSGCPSGQRPSRAGRRRPVQPRFTEVKRAESAPPPDPHWRQHLRTLRPLSGTVGAEYLKGRGVPADLAIAARVMFSPSWNGRPAVVFPARDGAGRLVAAQGRYTDGTRPPAWQPPGCRIGAGVFATPGALQSQTVALVEAPICALSLAACGLPALATFGSNPHLPAWLPRSLAFRRVLIATDADESGDQAEPAWAATLASLGARCERLRPAGGPKDWNDLLRQDSERLMAAVAALLASLEPAPAPAAAAEPAADVPRCRAPSDISQVQAGDTVRGRASDGAMHSGIVRSLDAGGVLLDVPGQEQVYLPWAKVLMEGEEREGG